MNHHSSEIVRRVGRSILVTSAGSLVVAVPAAAAMQRQVDDLVRYQIVLALLLLSLLAVQHILTVLRRLGKLKLAFTSLKDRNLTQERLEEIRDAHLRVAVERDPNSRSRAGD